MLTEYQTFPLTMVPIISICYIDVIAGIYCVLTCAGGVLRVLHTTVWDTPITAQLGTRRGRDPCLRAAQMEVAERPLKPPLSDSPFLADASPPESAENPVMAHSQAQGQMHN